MTNYRICWPHGTSANFVNALAPRGIPLEESCSLMYVHTAALKISSILSVPVTNRLPFLKHSSAAMPNPPQEKSFSQATIKWHFVPVVHMVK